MAGREELELALTCCQGLRDGEWVLATFEVGEASLSLAGRVVDRGEGLKLSFEARDFAQLEEFANSELSDTSSRPSGQHPPLSLHPPPNSRVLVVDDDADLQHVVSAMLRSSGFEVSAVSSAEEAFDHIRMAAVDLLILDWGLPGMSGIEFVRRLRKDRALGKLPVLFLTAHSSSDDLVEAFSAGADDFVSKPFRAPELGARILGLLRRSQGVEAR